MIMANKIKLSRRKYMQNAQKQTYDKSILSNMFNAKITVLILYNTLSVIYGWKRTLLYLSTHQSSTTKSTDVKLTYIWHTDNMLYYGSWTSLFSFVFEFLFFVWICFCLFFCSSIKILLCCAMVNLLD